MFSTRFPAYQNQYSRSCCGFPQPAMIRAIPAPPSAEATQNQRYMVSRECSRLSIHLVSSFKSEGGGYLFVVPRKAGTAMTMTIAIMHRSVPILLQLLMMMSSLALDPQGFPCRIASAVTSLPVPLRRLRVTQLSIWVRLKESPNTERDSQHPFPRLERSQGFLA